jgi:prophage tail gpP-like protein
LAGGAERGMPIKDDGDVSLVVGDRSISGWTEISIRRGVERCPADFDVALTELNPEDRSLVVAQPGDVCQVYIGDDLTITGYVDRFIPGIGGDRHDIRVVGRGLCQDLVDCSAIWPGSQISGATALGVAERLARPYGIAVGGEAGKVIPQFNLIVGETAWDVIERICRYSGLLVYDRPDGSLVLARLGTDKAASGLAEGENVQAATAEFAMDSRYSEIDVFLQSMDQLGELGEGGNLRYRATDPNVPRFRNMYLVAEAGGQGLELAKPRGDWEVARRLGRSRQVQAVVDSWRDAEGRLWEPNTLAPVRLPSLKLPDETWAITEVMYRRDLEAGTQAHLTLMPPEALLPQPVLLQPIWADVPVFGAEP